jgi:protein O-mannosyl-transferase
MPSTRLRSSASLLAVLLAAVLAAYANALGAAFQFDDYRVIVDNPAVHSWSAWLASMPGIRPLLKFSYLVNWLAAADPLGFHLVNLLCHLANTTLVFLLCRRFAAQFKTQADPATFAMLAALVFALHPVQTEAVTYVSGRSVSLMALFYLGAMFAFVEGRANGRLLQYAFISPLLFAAAMLVKETAWTLPMALFLWERAGRQQPMNGSLRALRVHVLVLAVIAVAILLNAHYRHLLAVSLATRAPLENLGAQIHGVFYLITAPLLALQVNADPTVALDVPGWMPLAKGAVLAGLVSAGFWQLRGRPWLGFGLLWFFVHLLPTNSVLARLDIANDRQLYLALIGPALLLAKPLSCALSRRKVFIASLLLSGVLGWATWQRNNVYASEIAFWEDTAAASPHKARVWNNLGFAYQAAGRITEAGAAYKQAVTLDPEHPRAGVNLRLLEESER